MFNEQPIFCESMIGVGVAADMVLKTLAFHVGNRPGVEVITIHREPAIFAYDMLIMIIQSEHNNRSLALVS